MAGIAGLNLELADQPASPERAPDWAKVSETVRCPICEYDLRGLSEPRCPECGRAFAWNDLLDPSRRLHPYLFEHHPERNAWSFTRTLLGGLRPRRFWTALQPQQPSSMPRLIGYWVIGVALAVACLVGPLWTTEYLSARQYIAGQRNWYRAWWTNPAFSAEQRTQITNAYGGIQGFLDTHYPPVSIWDVVLRKGPVMNHEAQCSVVALIVVWVCSPWATIAAFALLQTSMRQARVRTGHIMRVIIYSLDAFVLAAVAFAASITVVLVDQHLGRNAIGSPVLAAATTGAAGAASLLASMKLHSGIRHYLRFRHAAGVLVATQAIALLVTLWLLFTLPVTEAWTLDRANDLARALRRF